MKLVDISLYVGHSKEAKPKLSLSQVGVTFYERDTNISYIYSPGKKWSKAEGVDPAATNQGNVFNGTSQLVQTDGAGKLPAIDGSQLTNLPSASSGYTEATLPAGSVGDRAYVTDSDRVLAVAIGTTVVGGGANDVPVWHDGTNWLVG
jgi:hypothetical protein